MALESMNIVVVGGSGRMGRSLVQAAATQPHCQVVAAVVRESSALCGVAVADGPAGLRYTSELESALARADVVIDFSAAAAVAHNIHAYRRAAKPLLVGTTGLDTATERALTLLGERAPVMLAPNTSIGVTVLLELVRKAAALLPPDFDIEIVEAHHKGKQDLPSGTALALGSAAADGRRVPFEAAKVVRAKSGLRQAGEIGIAAIRAGDIVGKHTVLFAGAGEQVTLGHEATDRGIFASGALRAAQWLHRQPPGYYAMKDFIGL